MATGMWADLTLLISIVLGTTALTLCLLAWEILSESAVGRSVAALTVVMALFSFYHGISILLPQSELLTSLLKSLTLTGVALFIAVSIRFERKVADDSLKRGER